MSLEDVLKEYTPVENQDDSGFEMLKGTYLTAVTKLILETHAEYGERYELELTVNEVLDGNGSPGRKLWRRYKADDEGLKKLMNDLFTAKIEVPRSSVDEFNNSLNRALDKDVTLRAWGWTPEKTVAGEPIPEDERTARQQFKIVNAAKVKITKKPSEIQF